MLVRAYLRASTDEQDADRAKEEIKQFADSRGVRIAGYYSENISGTKVERPELNRLISDSEPGDILLVEKLDRLTRLPYEQWLVLRERLNTRGIVIVIVDQSMTHGSLTNDENSTFLGKVLTEFVINLAAGMARDDHETRAKRQRQGIDKAKSEGRYIGRKKDVDKRNKIAILLEDGVSWNKIISIVGCSRGTIASVRKEILPADD